MSWWKKVTLPDGRERYSANTDTMRLRVQNHFDGRPEWFIYDAATGSVKIAAGYASSVLEAMRAAEFVMLKGQTK